MSFLYSISQCHSLNQLWRHWDQLFWVILRTLVWKCSYWPCDLDFWHFNPKTIIFLGCPKFIPYIKFEHFVWDLSFLSYALNKLTDKQTNRRTDSNNPRRWTLSAWVITSRSYTWPKRPLIEMSLPKMKYAPLKHAVTICVIHHYTSLYTVYVRD